MKGLRTWMFFAPSKIKQSQNLEYGWTEYQWPHPNENDASPKSGTYSMPNSPKSGLSSLPLQIKIESHILANWHIKDQWSHPNQDQYAKPQSRAFSILQSPNSVLQGHECSLHLQNKDRNLILGMWVYQRPVAIFKSRPRGQTPSRKTWRTLEVPC